MSRDHFAFARTWEIIRLLGSGSNVLLSLSYRLNTSRKSFLGYTRLRKDGVIVTKNLDFLVPVLPRSLFRLRTSFDIRLINSLQFFAKAFIPSARVPMHRQRAKALFGDEYRGSLEKSRDLVRGHAVSLIPGATSAINAERECSSDTGDNAGRIDERERYCQFHDYRRQITPNSVIRSIRAQPSTYSAGRNLILSAHKPAAVRYR